MIVGSRGWREQQGCWEWKGWELKEIQAHRWGPLAQQVFPFPLLTHEQSGLQALLTLLRLLKTQQLPLPPTPYTA